MTYRPIITYNMIVMQFCMVFHGQTEAHLVEEMLRRAGRATTPDWTLHEVQGSPPHTWQATWRLSFSTAKAIEDARRCMRMAITWPYHGIKWHTNTLIVFKRWLKRAIWHAIG